MNDLEVLGPTALPLAGVELGGTKCVVTLAHDPQTVLDQRVVPTEAPEETLAALVEIMSEWQRTIGFRALGIASFGPIDLNPASASFGAVLKTNKPGWSGADVLHVLSKPFGLPTEFDTDVNGAALAEIRWGCARGFDDFAYVTVGTGIGVGLIVHGRPTRGIGHSEIGHLRLPRLPGDRQESVCRFHDDCVEGLASGTALLARLGDGRTVEEVSADDPVWTPIVEALVVMCHDLVCTTGPQRIAIGGGVVSKQPHLIERINRALVESLNGYFDLPEQYAYIVAPALGAAAGPLGSIALAANAFTRASSGGDVEAHPAPNQPEHAG